MNSYEEMRALYDEKGKAFEACEFQFAFAISSFLKYYSKILSLSGLEKITSVNQGQLSHYVTGHLKPGKKTVDNYFGLSLREQTVLYFVLNHIKAHLQNLFKPDGFNVGINIGEKAGQTIPHVHIHLIPRYSGDMDDPEGGVRAIIPKKRKYR